MVTKVSEARGFEMPLYEGFKADVVKVCPGCGGELWYYIETNSFSHPGSDCEWYKTSSHLETAKAFIEAERLPTRK